MHLWPTALEQTSYDTVRLAEQVQLSFTICIVLTLDWSSMEGWWRLASLAAGTVGESDVYLYCLPSRARDTEIGFTSLGPDIVLLGASVLLLHNELGLFVTG